MKSNLRKKATIVSISGVLLLLILFALLFAGDTSNRLVSVAALGIAALILAIGTVYVILIAKGQIKQPAPDYRALFVLGVVFMTLGMAGTNAFFVLGLAFLAIGLFNRKKWAPTPTWNEHPRAHLYFRAAVVVCLVLLLLAGIITWLLTQR